MGGIWHRLYKRKEWLSRMNKDKIQEKKSLIFAVIGTIIAIILRKQSDLVILFVIIGLVLSFIGGFIYYTFIKEKDGHTLNKSIIFISAAIAGVGFIFTNIEEVISLHSALCMGQFFLLLLIIGIRNCYLNRGNIKNKGALYFGIGTCFILSLMAIVEVIAILMGVSISLK